MKKLIFIFIMMLQCVGIPVAQAAVTIKKAAPVATKQSAPTDIAGSLLPTVLGLYSSVQELSAQQKKLTADCVPTAQEVSFVNDLVKEWAKTGAMSAQEVAGALRRQPCDTPTGGYKMMVESGAMNTGSTLCFDYYGGEGNDGMIWEGYPIVGKESYCTDGSMTCSESKKATVSDIYDIFALIDFTEKDFATQNEVTMAAKILSKVENCSNSKLSQKKRAMWGEFLTKTISSVGQPTNTGSIMETVSSFTTSGGGLQSLGSLGSIAGQFLQ